MNVYPFIEAEKRGRRNVKRACELLKVSRAAFYAYLSGPSGRDQDDADLAAKIQAVHEESRGRYGAPRVHAELRRRGQRHGRKRVARLMRQAGLRAGPPRRWKKTTIADPAAAARADRIRRDFTADASRLNSRWCGDITYIRTWEGWLFLATVIDIASRRVVGLRDGRSPAHRADRRRAGQRRRRPRPRPGRDLPLRQGLPVHLC